MKKISGFFVLLFFISSFAYATKIKGIIITKTDTLHVLFVIPLTGINYTTMQYGVKYIDSAQNKHKLSPADAKEIRFEYEGDSIRMLSRFDNISFNSDGSGKIFLKLKIDGPLKLFSYYVSSSYMSTPGGAGSAPMMSSSTSEKYVLQKGNHDLRPYWKMNFKNDMPVFLNTCPDLVNMIKNKLYHKSDIERIVHYYNTNCGNNQ